MTQASARHLLVDTEEQCLTLKTQIENGEDFAEVAKLVSEDHILSLRARGPEFKETRLQIGMKAPEIVGTSVRGNDMKLSDYEGKVVVLDFWGNW